MLLSPVHPSVEDDMPVFDRNLKEVVLPDEGICIRRRLSMVPPLIPKTKGGLLPSFKVAASLGTILGEGDGGSSSTPPVVSSPSVLLPRMSKASLLLGALLPCSAMTASPSASTLSSLDLFGVAAPDTKFDLLALRSICSIPEAEALRGETSAVVTTGCCTSMAL